MGPTNGPGQVRTSHKSFPARKSAKHHLCNELDNGRMVECVPGHRRSDGHRELAVP